MIRLVTKPGTIPDTDSATFSEVLALIEDQPPDARTLYYRWEREQWEVSIIDLSRDIGDWAAIDEATRKSLCAALACVVPPGEKLGKLLVPYVDAVESEEQQVFLTSQLVDQARSVVFGTRLTTELGMTLEPNGGIDQLLDLVQARGDEVRVKREQNETLYEGILIHNIMYEGVISTAFLSALGGYLEGSVTFPGLRAGLVSLTRDLTRHVLFAIRLLQEAIDRDRGSNAGAIESAVEISLPLVSRSISSGAASTDDFAGLPFKNDDLSTTALETFARRMQDIRIDLPT